VKVNKLKKRYTTKSGVNIIPRNERRQKLICKNSLFAYNFLTLSCHNTNEMFKFSKIATATILLTVSLLVSCARQPIVTKDIESPFFGSKNSKAQIEIFSDFQCPACINFHEKIGKKLESDYVKTGKIGYLYKNFPLPFHKNAPDDASAAMCAYAQGKFLEFADKMYALEKEKDGLNVDDSERINIAKDLGLDTEKFTTCITEGHYINKVASDSLEAQNRGVEGTPTIFLNGVKMSFETEAQFFGMIEATLK